MVCSWGILGGLALVVTAISGGRGGALRREVPVQPGYLFHDLGKGATSPVPQFPPFGDSRSVALGVTALQHFSEISALILGIPDWPAGFQAAFWGSQNRRAGGR